MDSGRDTAGSLHSVVCRGVEKMEHQAARRRVGRILDHVACSDVVSPPTSHLFPMNCSHTLNTMVRRSDNRLLFARQGSVSQASFMQQVSVKQNFETGNSSQQDSRCNCSYQHAGEPLFSRKSQEDSIIFSARGNDQSMKQDCTVSSTGAPMFARQNSGKNERTHSFCDGTTAASTCIGMVWSPRVDVVESRSNYTVIVELPGVRIPGIRVEMDDESLIVMGERTNQQQRADNSSESLDSKYLQREILQGPYRAAWPLPNDVNRDGVSAEFLDGFLRITLPKL